MNAEPSPDWILKLSQEIQSQMNWELTELKTSVSTKNRQTELQMT